jgi:hypothetical protein
MPTEKYTGAVQVKTSGRTTTVELLVPTGTRLRDALKVADIVKVEAIRKFQPGGCLQCTSGRHFGLSEIKSLPARLSKNMSAFDLKTGKLFERP